MAAGPASWHKTIMLSSSSDSMSSSRLTAPGGLIGLSGVLFEQSPDVIQAYSAFFDDMKVEDRSPDGWCLITGRRKA